MAGAGLWAGMGGPEREGRHRLEVGTGNLGEVRIKRKRRRREGPNGKGGDAEGRPGYPERPSQVMQWKRSALV